MPKKQQIEFLPMLSVIRLGLKDPSSKKRLATAERMRGLDLFPEIGTVAGSRKHKDRCHAVPRDVLEELIQAAIAKEQYLKELVDLGLQVQQMMEETDDDRKPVSVSATDWEGVKSE